MTNNKENIKISFELTLDEANLILKALGKMPFEQVFELIGKLNQQANKQLAANNEVENHLPNN